MPHQHHCSNDIYELSFVFKNLALYRYHLVLSIITQRLGIFSKPKNMPVSTVQVPKVI